MPLILAHGIPWKLHNDKLIAIQIRNNNRQVWINNYYLLAEEYKIDFFVLAINEYDNEQA